MAVTITNYDDLQTSGVVKASAGLQMESFVAELALAGDVSVVLTPKRIKTKVVNVIINRVHDTTTATAATEEWQVDADLGSDKTVDISSAGTVTLTRVLGDTGGALTADDYNITLLGY